MVAILELTKFPLILMMFLGETTKVCARGHQLLFDLLLLHHYAPPLGVLRNLTVGFVERVHRNTRVIRLQYGSEGIRGGKFSAMNNVFCSGFRQSAFYCDALRAIRSSSRLST